MIISNPQTIQVLLGGAVATNELPIASAWVNMLDDGSTFSPGNTLTETNGTTAVTVVAAPAASNNRQLKYLSIVNADTAPVTVTVRVDTSGTPTNLLSIDLAVGYRLEYTFTNGVRVFDDAGALVGTGGGSAGGTVDSVVAGTGIDVDSSDAANPIVELDAATIASLGLADSATQPGDNISTLTNDAGYTTNTGDVQGPGSSTDNAVVRFNGTGGTGIQDSGVLVTDNNEISGYRGHLNQQTGTSYTLQTSDAGKIVELTNGSAIALTAAPTLPQGFACTIVQGGAGQVTVASTGSGSVVNRQSQFKTAGQNAMCALYVRSNSGSNAVFVLGGDTAA